MRAYANLEFTDQFLSEFAGSRFSATERGLILKALHLLDTDERHPSLRVHALRADLAGQWSASASGTLRITFERRPEDRKVLKSISRHYDR